MKTVKAKLKGTDVTFEGSICDGYFYVSCDHNDFYRLNLDEIEICKDSLQVPETCKENADSFTCLEEAAARYEHKNRQSILSSVDIVDAFIAGAEWQYERLGKQAREQLSKDEITLADLVAFDEGLKLGRELERRDMMKDAVEGKVFMSFAPGHNQMVMADVDLPTNTNVKLIIVKQDE